MSKIQITDNWRVVLDVDRPWMFGNKSEEEKNERWRSACKTLISNVKRHCDGFSNIDYECDSYFVCSFCGNLWEEDSDGIPVCCDKAVAEWENNKVLDKS